MQFMLNNTAYEIHSFEDYRLGRNDQRMTGYFWGTELGAEGSVFNTILEAQQDAIRHAEAGHNDPGDWLDKQRKLFCMGE